jgi:hypothetical protein
VSASPGDVDELVTYVNALGAEHAFPLTLSCVVESLDRPLGILAARSDFSLQPAFDVRSPRFFLCSGSLVMTVVPTGIGRDLLELGTEVSEVRSIKAEIVFPLQGPLPPVEPYEHIFHDGQTSCAACHGTERSRQLPTGTAFESDVLRPLASQEVDLAFARDEYVRCDPAQDKERCAILSSIFAHGELQPRAFSPNAKTIYDNRPGAEATD